MVARYRWFCTSPSPLFRFPPVVTSTRAGFTSAPAAALPTRSRVGGAGPPSALGGDLIELSGEFRLAGLGAGLHVLLQLGEHRLVEIAQGHQGVALAPRSRRQSHTGAQAQGGQAEGPHADLPVVCLFHSLYSFGPRPEAAAQALFENGNVPSGEGFFRQTRRFDAAILCGLQGKSTQYGGKRPAVWVY